MIDVILIDANGVGQALHRATKLSYGGMQVQAIFGLAKSLRDTRLAAPNAKIFALWDGHAKHRYAILPTYKVDRETKRTEDKEEADSYAAYQRQKPVMAALLNSLGIPQIRHPDLEADDCAGMLAPAFSAAGKRVLLTTGDTDWLHLVDERVEWYDPRNGGKKITLANFAEQTGYFTPHAHIQGKALQGDTSDSIPPVGGIGGKGAITMLATYGSVDAFLAKYDSGYRSEVPRYKKAFNEFAASSARQNFATNMQLMNLRSTAPVPLGQILQAATPGQFNEANVKEIFSRLGFASLLSNFNNWLDPFRPKEQQ